MDRSNTLGTVDTLEKVVQVEIVDTVGRSVHSGINTPWDTALWGTVGRTDTVGHSWTQWEPVDTVDTIGHRINLETIHFSCLAVS